MTRVSIKDVAERAGVSTATVSHVINETRFVRAETRQRVLEAIEALNYQPSAIARSLVTNSTQTVGLVVSDIRNPFFTAIARGVEDEISKHDYHTIFCDTDEEPVREEAYLKLLAARQIDGLIIAPTGVYSERLVQMVNAGVPVVLIDRTSPGIEAPLVGVDNEGGAYQAVRYLLDLGHRRIGLLAGLETMSTMRARLYGYRLALESANIPVDEDLIVPADPRFDSKLNLATSGSDFSGDDQETPSSYHAFQRLLDLPDRPSAIFAANNQIALGVLHALKQRNMPCPAGMSLIIFDDIDWAALFSPALTVVRQPTYELGQVAARLLIQLIRGEAAQAPPPLPVELIIRESCARFTPGYSTTGPMVRQLSKT
jgi:LacI family transcriptional regulator